MFGAKDFRVIVSDAFFNEMEQQWCPPDLEVFKLVPDHFQIHVTRLYESIGSPTVSSNNFWTVYASLYNAFKDDSCLETLGMQNILSAQCNFDPLQSPVDIPIPSEWTPLRNDRYFQGTDGDQDVGGAPHGMDFTAGNEVRVFTDFTDEE